jgi:Flp pilus assembly pilin Flp
MLDRDSLKKYFRSGQSVLEYAILIAFISAAFLTMAIYVRRAVQGGLSMIGDRVEAKGNVIIQTNPWVPPI